MPRRVRRPESKEKIYRALTDGEQEVFDTYKDVFMMAACLGFVQGELKSFDKSAEGIAWSVFSGQTDLPIINAIALNATEDVSCLLNDEDTFDRKLTIVEEYAHIGIDILKTRIIDAPGDPLDNLMNLMDEYKNKAEEDPLDISQFSNLFS